MLPDGRELHYSLPDGIGGFEPPELVGWDLPPISSNVASAISPDVEEMLGKDAFFVKAFLESGSEQSYMLQHVNGFVNKYAFLRPNEVTRIFKAQLEQLAEPSDYAAVEYSETQVVTEALPPKRDVSQPATLQGESQPATARPRRQALLTMHLLGDEEGADGSERHNYALQAVTDQMSMFGQHGVEASISTSQSRETSLSKTFNPTHEAMPHIMKAVLDMGNNRI
jgi:hypothetical protein